MEPLSNPRLPPRLNALLALLSLGAPTGEIMREMGLSRRVVHVYISRVAERLEVPDAMRGPRVRYAIVRIAEREATIAAARKAIETLAA